MRRCALGGTRREGGAEAAGAGAKAQQDVGGAGGGWAGARGQDCTRLRSQRETPWTVGPILMFTSISSVFDVFSLTFMYSFREVKPSANAGGTQLAQKKICDLVHTHFRPRMQIVDELALIGVLSTTPKVSDLQTLFLALSS